MPLANIDTRRERAGRGSGEAAPGRRLPGRGRRMSLNRTRQRPGRTAHSRKVVQPAAFGTTTLQVPPRSFGRRDDAGSANALRRVVVRPERFRPHDRAPLKAARAVRPVAPDLEANIGACSWLHRAFRPARVWCFPAPGLFNMWTRRRPAGDRAKEMIVSRRPSLYGGTDEIQKNIIGERVLGLPKEPGPDKVLTPFMFEGRHAKMTTDRTAFPPGLVPGRRPVDTRDYGRDVPADGRRARPR